MDYTIPSHLAALLEKNVQPSQLFTSGMITYINLTELSGDDSYFVQSTWDAYAQHVGESVP